MNRQDIKTMLDRLEQVEIQDEYDRCCIESAYHMLIDLGNRIAHLEADKASLKQELKNINKAIDDPALDLTMTTSECILKIRKENIKLKQDILHLEAMIED